MTVRNAKDVVASMGCLLYRLFAQLLIVSLESKLSIMQLMVFLGVLQGFFWFVKKNIRQGSFLEKSLLQL